jgi:hypothetical protein
MFDNIVILDGTNYESYLVQNNYNNEIIKAINEYEGDKPSDYSLPYFENCKKNYTKNHKSDNSSDENMILIECMKVNKVKYASTIAQTICRECSNDRKYPPKILELMQKVKMFMDKNK